MRIRRKAWALPELEKCPYYFQTPSENKNNWQTIASKKPIHLDLGCGKAIFLAEIAYENPQIHYVGIDISTDILGVARRNIQTKFDEKAVQNISLFSYNIEKLEDVFSAEDKIERIYINFCNPWPKAGDHKKRLTHSKQLTVYKKLLTPGAEIWFKTDNDDLYLASLRYFREAGLEIFFHTKNLHQEKQVENHLTEHEIMFTREGITTKAIRAKYKEE